MTIEDVPLPFDIPEQPRRRSNAGPERRQPLKAVAFGRCPGCHTFKAVGLIPMGAHLVWRAHTYPVYFGQSRPCPASLVRLCEQPADVLPGVTTDPPKCRCER